MYTKRKRCRVYWGSTEEAVWKVYIYMYMYDHAVLNAWFNDCILRFLPTLRIQQPCIVLDLLLRVQMIANPRNSHLIDTHNQNQSYGIYKNYIPACVHVLLQVSVVVRTRQLKP